MDAAPPLYEIAPLVSSALAEDIGSGDLTAALLPEEAHSQARIIVREPAILCGQPWAEEVLRQVDPRLRVHWAVPEGASLKANDLVCELSGQTRALLTAERTFLNFLQTLSGTATVTHHYAGVLEGFSCVVMDTRKTLPGFRLAQKYAVRVGGGANQRTALYDGILIKENHILAAGSIRQAFCHAQAMAPAGVSIQIEVETLAELEEALAAGATLILLDNMEDATLKQAVALNQGRAQLEASGNVTLERLKTLAEIGMDRVSVGALTKHLHSIDFSMRLI